MNEIQKTKQFKTSKERFLCNVLSSSSCTTGQLQVGCSKGLLPLQYRSKSRTEAFQQGHLMGPAELSVQCRPGRARRRLRGKLAPSATAAAPGQPGLPARFRSARSHRRGLAGRDEPCSALRAPSAPRGGRRARSPSCTATGAGTRAGAAGTPGRWS